jgi:hypothetical protein
MGFRVCVRTLLSQLSPVGTGWTVEHQKRSLGCAHHFRPRYAVANVGHPSISSDSALTQTPAGLLDCAFVIQDYVH